MSNNLKKFVLSAILFALQSVNTCWADAVRDVTNEVQVTYNASPISAKIEWKAPINSATQSGLNIFRRDWSDLKTAGSGQPGFVLVPGTQANSLSFTDSTISLGRVYEYNLITNSASGTRVSNFPVGYNIPWREKRGAVLLLVDSSIANSLVNELNTFALDLTLDGYLVTRVDSARMQTDPEDQQATTAQTRLAEIVDVRNKINQWYLQNPTSNQSLVIVGRIPIPYIGSVGADSHPDHHGAWSSDAYYADLVGLNNNLPIWNDTGNFSTTGVLLRTQNIAADGKLDQNRIPSSQVELQIGRIDFSRLSFANEIDLYKRYFARNHLYRQRTGPYTTIDNKFLIDDNFGVYSSGESFARVAWEGSATIFNRNAAFLDDWFNNTTNNPFFLAYGCGLGSFTNSAGVGSSTDFQTRPSKSPFTALFGSYFGDWDYPDGLLPTVIAGSQDSLALTTIWANRDNIDLSPLAVGASIGAVTARKTNYSNTGSLLGDPTLRLQYISPVQAISATREASSITVRWAASQSEVIGYHVLRAESASGPFVRITGAPVTTTRPDGSPLNALSFVDSSPERTRAVAYAVVAIAKISSGTTVYFDSSQAISTAINEAPSAAPNAPSLLRLP